ncbi:hypothetical protein Scani_55050 [Streptomyces caniferus]|uniref:Uncharacterized protein n=1 Tax=Streptomyces caniferus TaxID=285557 RepID=A0A640SDJ8_9ACTN|nr:hypothetical protein Scani_55050 [Streptomyces caniferus]
MGDRVVPGTDQQRNGFGQRKQHGGDRTAAGTVSMAAGDDELPRLAGPAVARRHPAAFPASDIRERAAIRTP